MQTFSGLCARARAFLKAKAGNLTIIFALSIIPLTLAMGAGIDYARGLVVHSNMNAALDAAGLAVGAAATKPSACSSDGSASASTGNGPTGSPTPCASMQKIAQQYFDANFKQDSAADTVSKVQISIVNQSVVLTVTDDVPTTFLMLADRLMNSTNLDKMHVVASTTVVWGQTKLWVSLVLDNTGSMCEPDSQPCTTNTNANIKMNAMKTASHSLLATLKNASTTPGDVLVALVPFAKDVNVGTGNVGATWIDWTNWNAAMPAGNTPSVNVGPGDDCPFSSTYGKDCLTVPGGAINATDKVSMITTDKVPASGNICPGAVTGSSVGQNGHYYNGCFTSVAVAYTDGPRSGATCGSYTHCTCSGSGNNKKCTGTYYNHTWVTNAKSTWRGCVMDRNQNDDANNTTPGTLFPAQNVIACPTAPVSLLTVPSTTAAMNTMFANLNTQIDAMTANGATNQTVGLAHGMQMLVSGLPYSAPTLPASTTRYIILLSDGFNTQDRWYGNGSAHSDDVDDRMTVACNNAKTQKFVVYTIFVDLGSKSGNSDVMLKCATDASKYYHLTTAGAIITTFNDIAAEITNLRVSM